jgi:hypothetical protein
MSAANSNHNLTLITGPRAYTRQHMFDLLIETALRQPVRMLLGGNDFPVYEIAYALAARFGDVYTILEEGITLSRAETGYQLAELLRQTPTAPTVTLAADLLSPLMDEGLRDKEAGELLFACLLELRRMGKAAPVYISAAQPKARPHLLMALTRAVDAVQKPPPGLPAPQPQTGLRF